MPPNLQDRRVQRTRQLLREAMFKLVQEKGYYSISIQELTDQANLGKATFYLQYKDKDELLYECMDSILMELSKKISLLPRTRWNPNDTRPPRIAFEFAAENAKFMKVMIHDPGGLKFLQRLQKLTVDMLTNTIQTNVQGVGAHPLVPLEFLTTSYAGSLLATLEWWIDNGMPYSIDEMVDMYSKTNALSLKEILGMDGEQNEREDLNPPPLG